MGNGVLVGVISSDVECPLVILWGTPTGDCHRCTQWRCLGWVRVKELLTK